MSEEISYEEQQKKAYEEKPIGNGGKTDKYTWIQNEKEVTGIF
jgi:hypothetical protein